MFWNYFKKSFSLLNMDAWSDGQTESKLWLCKEVEKLHHDGRIKAECIWIYGSWYGTLAYLLLARERLPIKRIRCFDIDQSANKIALRILNHWICKGFDVQICEYNCEELSVQSGYYLDAPPDLIINTSCEHFAGYQWWKNVPAGVDVVAQSTDMKHPTHINSPTKLEDFVQNLSGSEIYFQGQKYFEYPALKFSRFMFIGKKI